MSASDSDTIHGLPPREVAFRHLASDAWIGCELAKRRVTSGFDRRRPGTLASELMDAWWALVVVDPSPSLFRPGLAPEVPARPAPAPVSRPPPTPPVPPPPTPARSAPKPPLAPPVKEARFGLVPPAPRAPPPKPPAATARDPGAPAAAVVGPSFSGLPAGVRELAKGLSKADLPGAPALKRLIGAHVPHKWPNGADLVTHPAWDVLVVAGARSIPPIPASDLLPLFRAVLAVVTDDAGAEAVLDDVLRWGPVPGATCAVLLENLPLLRGSPVPVCRAWEVIDAVTRPPEGLFGEADHARLEALAGSPAGDGAPKPVIHAPTGTSTPPSDRWASSLARLRPNVRVAVSAWLNDAPEHFGRASTWGEALAYLRKHPGLARPIEAFPEEAWAILVEASPVIAQGSARAFIDPTHFGQSERHALTAAVDRGEAPALAERLRDALLGGPSAAIAAPIDALLAALPSSAITNENDARDPPYGRHARWDGTRLSVAWPKHAAWKDGAPPSTRVVRVPFWPSSRGGAGTGSYEIHETLLPHVAQAFGSPVFSLADFQDDFDRARAGRREDQALATLRAELIAGYDDVQRRIVVEGDLATDARRTLEATTADALELG